MLTLMAVHAHPDDESSSTGGVLALYSAQGVRTVVVTCTNGEYGDGPEHVKPGEPGHDPGAVAATRLGELKVACDALGVGHLETLGYHDSGMSDWEFRNREDVFCNVPLAESTARLVELFERYQPDVVITYDDAGGYNHPDHLQAHRITVAACESWTPSKLYFIGRRRRDFERIRSLMEAAGVEMPSFPTPDPERIKRMEAAEARITTTVDVSSVAAQKGAALAAHASQLDQSWFVRLPSASFGEVWGHESFIRVIDSTGANVPEVDLFVGLR